MKKTIFMIMGLFFAIGLAGCRDDSPTILNIESVPTLATINVDTYTDFDELDLPFEVTVTLSDGTEDTVLVAWDAARVSYLNATTETVVLSGRLILSGFLTNAKGLTLDVTINIARVSLMEAITRQPQFSILEEAVIAVGLSSYFEGDHTLTLFAPNNAAFTNFFTVYGLDKESFLALDDLADILSYHVIERTHSTEAILGFTPLDLVSLEGSQISLTDQEGLLINSYAHIVDGNRESSNGVLHEIDNVLIPPAIATELSGTFFDESLLDTFADILAGSDLVTALILSGQISLDGTTELTLFAPSDTAFQSLIDTYGLTIDELLAFEEIDQILLNHAVIGSYLADQLFLDAPTTLESIAGNNLSVTVVEGTLMIEGARFESTVEGFPVGQVHVIDQVLLTDAMAAALLSYAAGL
ncbi:MAG: fasciclin domain-containing protein [Acholeplasmataceae bacterium]|nr:fasciclin domain-containing protein [Acholeplasmataceae bacterium]